jgi:hypothetical protein
LRIALVALLAAATSSCIMPARYASGADGTGWGRKPVEAKDAPATLVARDGSVCTVSRDRFERVRLGDRVICFWSDGGRALPERGRR